jgi:hypothetical protein
MESPSKEGAVVSGTKNNVKFMRYPQVIGDFSTIPVKYRNEEDFKKKERLDKLKAQYSRYRMTNIDLAKCSGKNKSRNRSASPRKGNRSLSRKLIKQYKRRQNMVNTRSKSPNRAHLKGKICDHHERRWGDYHKVALEYEQKRMKELPVCYELFNPLEHYKNRNDEWDRRVKVYNYEETRHFYDNKPHRSVLSKMNKTMDYGRIMPEASNLDWEFKGTKGQI